MERFCKECGKRFLFLKYEQDFFKKNNWDAPIRCPKCRKEERERRLKIEQIKIDEEKKKQIEKEAPLFENALKSWEVVDINEISPVENKVLYVIGNGFDMMHGASSSYDKFRDFLGKKSRLRTTLEDYLTADNIWADFENALGTMNINMVCNEALIDMFLDMFEAYDEDAGVAPYFMTIDNAVSPIDLIANELPNKFFQWVNTLAVGTEDRPLKSLFTSPCKVLCFNYTEFVETMYGISHDNVCYIHGYRKGREQLVLGHIPSNNYYTVENDDLQVVQDYKQGLIKLAMMNANDRFVEDDEELTKDSRKIIEKHKDFFTGLKYVEKIIIIGHSLSEVDTDYFSAIKSECQDAQWFFGCFCLGDLKRVAALSERLGISRDYLKIFRTDGIKVEKIKEDINSKTEIKEKELCVSDDRVWRAKKYDDLLIIDKLVEKENIYSVSLPLRIRKGVFSEHSEYLFVVVQNENRSLLIFKRNGYEWNYLSEITKNDSDLFSCSLKHIFHFEDELLFVYSNRLLRFCLLNGDLIENKKKMNADKMNYNGKDMLHDLYYRKHFFLSALKT